MIGEKTLEGCFLLVEKNPETIEKKQHTFNILEGGARHDK